MGTLHEDQYTFFITSPSVLRMRNVSDKSCRGNQNTHFVFSNNFFQKSCHLCGNVENVEKTRPQMTIWCMHFACWVTKAIDAHSEYVILIAFPLQPWLHECASVFCYMYIVCLVLLYYWSYKWELFSSLPLSCPHLFLVVSFPGLYFYSSILIYKLFKFLIIFFWNLLLLFQKKFSWVTNLQLS